MPALPQIYLEINLMFSYKVIISFLMKKKTKRNNAIFGIFARKKPLKNNSNNKGKQWSWRTAAKELKRHKRNTNEKWNDVPSSLVSQGTFDPRCQYDMNS